MKIKFIAQSGFIIETKQGLITIDLWLDNPLHKLELKDVPKTDYVFITHDHADHDLPTGIELAKRDKSHFISNYDIMKHAQEQGVENIAPGNIGGLYPVGDIEIAQTHAEHSSNIGLPVGFIIKVEGKTLYHMGDTGYFKGLDTLAEFYNIDILFVPIGSRYTMGPKEASLAVADIKPKIVIPMHYNT
ncbi:MAG TPA: metal-dependent hydrolase, partial [bacterium]|nr:metal-dependent hydrolase [bacterium]